MPIAANMGKKTKEFYVIAHNIRSLFNVGSIFRTADALGAAKIYLTGYTGTPENPIHRKKISKSALGAEEWVPWEHKKSIKTLIKQLKSAKVRVIALENNVKAINLSKYKPKFPMALILGEEVNGVSKDILKACDFALEIPMQGKKESLNVSVAFGIAAYHLMNE